MRQLPLLLCAACVVCLRMRGAAASLEDLAAVPSAGSAESSLPSFQDAVGAAGSTGSISVGVAGSTAEQEARRRRAQFGLNLGSISVEAAPKMVAPDIVVTGSFFADRERTVTPDSSLTEINSSAVLTPWAGVFAGRANVSFRTNFDIKGPQGEDYENTTYLETRYFFSSCAHPEAVMTHSKELCPDACVPCPPHCRAVAWVGARVVWHTM